jgi:hypothetical protein
MLLRRILGLVRSHARFSGASFAEEVMPHRARGTKEVIDRIWYEFQLRLSGARPEGLRAPE